jgi:Domain of unknown function (DUF6894)
MPRRFAHERRRVQRASNVQYTLRLIHADRISSGCDPIELPGDEDARREAVLIGHDLWDDPGECLRWRNWTVEISDDRGRRVASVSSSTIHDVEKRLASDPRRLAPAVT